MILEAKNQEHGEPAVAAIFSYILTAYYYVMNQQWLPLPSSFIEKT